MAAITVTTNLGGALSNIRAKLTELKNPELLTKPLATEQIRLMADRIHINGEASDGGQIGTYSNGYLKVRAANARKDGSKVIISLTRQLENDYAVIANSKSGYGVGFNNPLNRQKAGWVEETYGKRIFRQTKEEREAILQFLNEIVHDTLNS